MPHTPSRAARRRATRAASALIAGAALTAAPNALAATPAPNPFIATPPSATQAAPPKADPLALEVKFRDGTDVSAAGDDLSFGSAALQQRIDAILGAGVAQAEPVFDGIAPSKLDAQRERLQNQGKHTADLTAYVRIKLDPGTDRGAVLTKLNADPSVQTAYPTPAPVSVAITIDPKYQAAQWADPSASGMGVTAAAGIPGALGDNVNVHQLEYGIDEVHDDLPPITRLTPNSSTESDYIDHGTKTAGMILAKRNGIGIDGLAPSTHLFFRAIGEDEAPAITASALQMQRGDVMQMALQTSGHIPIESTPATYDAIRTATQSGVIVVEAAGNGNKDLDHLDPTTYAGSTFLENRPDSGAIIVGAGRPASCFGTALSKISYSDYGSRVNVQAPADCVYSLAAGNGYSYYDGTSVASSITSGVTAALSSAYEQATGAGLAPLDARAALVKTGLPQADPQNGKIGPQINLIGAINELTSAPDTQLVGGRGGDETHPSFSFGTASLGVTGYDCRFVPAGGPAPAFAPCSGATSHTASSALADGKWTFEVRARKGPNGAVDSTPASTSFWVVSGTAATATLPGGTQVNVAATPGATDAITVTQSGFAYQVDDSAKVKAGSGCFQKSITSAVCYVIEPQAVKVDAGDGNDTVTFNMDSTLGTANGGAGNDTLNAGPGGASLTGGLGDDTLNPGAGVDTLDESGRTDDLDIWLSSSSVSGSDAAQGDDTLGGAFEHVIAGSGNDTVITSGSTPLQLESGAGNDTIVALSTGADTIDAGPGDDVINDGPGNDRYFGGAGNDEIDLYSTGGSDEVNGGDDTDLVSYASVSSAVTLSADGVANDGIPGATAQLDNVMPDVEELTGGNGADTLIATATTTQLDGGAGDDRLVAAVAHPAMIGGTGSDTVDLSGRSQKVTFTAFAGANQIGAVQVGGGSAAFTVGVESLIGTEFADTFTGGTTSTSDRPVTIDGRGGNDTITGGTAGDTLIGGAGVDTISGRDGNDDLRSRDNAAGDQVTCGNGTDKVDRDATDTITDPAACESVTS